MTAQAYMLLALEDRGLDGKERSKRRAAMQLTGLLHGAAPGP
jgi:hypothetical protein